MRRSHNFIDLTDRKFNRLYVEEFAYTKKGQTYWKCVCECGNTKTINGGHLRNGHTKSCGCLSIEKSTERIKKHHKTGKEASNYNPYLTDEDRADRRYIPGYKEWRIEVFKRDDYTCRKCNVKGEYLNAHHIESYNSNPELRTEVLNGITLCEDCHKDFHHQYGRGNNTRAQLIEFLRRCND